MSKVQTVSLSADDADDIISREQEKANHTAFLIQITNQWIFQMDEEYLLECAKILRAKADRYDSAAVLIRNWNQEHSKVIMAQAEALEHLAKYILANKKVTELKKKEANLNDLAEELNNLFH